MEQLPWWKKDVDEMWAMALLGAVAIVSICLMGDSGGKDVALVAVGAYAVYLGKGKNSKS
jgi:hypothetical protein